MISSVGIVGSGNVGTALYRAFKQKNIPVNWYSRSPEGEQKAFQTSFLDEEILLLAVPDDVIIAAAQDLKVADRTTVAHVSGASPLEPLATIFGTRAGVFYPLQTIRKNADLDWTEIPICIEAIGENTREKLWTLGEQISSRIVSLETEKRQKIHLAAVIINNFSNHLAVLTRDLLKEEKLPYDLLHPIIRESADKILKGDFTQTGPARRGDVSSMEKHLGLLESDPSLKELYLIISNHIYTYYNS